MAKANPLFIDSTKMIGDSIGTQFEVSKIALYEGEGLFVLITNHLGTVTRMPMVLNEELNYQTKVWLAHQKQFSYQFVIEKDGQRILQSAPQKNRAKYAILEKWEPVLAEEHADPGEPCELSVSEMQTNIPELSKSLAGLIDKFGF
jgi:hypothetical protein